MRLFALVLGMALMTSVAFAQTPDAALEGSVYGTANVRSGPDTRYSIVTQLSANAPVTVIGRDGDPPRWLYVTLETGEQGWLPVFVISLGGADPRSVPIVTSTLTGVGTPAPTSIATVEPSEVEVTAIAYGRVNVRNEPSIAGLVIGQLDVDDRVMVTARCCETNDWLYVNFNEGRTGWVAYFTVTIEGPVDELPVLVPDSSGESLIPPEVLLRTRFNARLREEPSLLSPTILIVPFSSEVTPLARTADGEWLYVGFEGQVGWGATGLFIISTSALAELPIYVGGTPTPEAVGTLTPTPTATPQS